MKFIFLPLEYKLYMHIGTWCILIALFMVGFLIISHHFKRLSLNIYIKVEEYCIAILVSSIYYHILQLPFALMLWLITYWFYGKTNLKNHCIRYAIKFCSNKENKATRNQSKIYHRIIANVERGNNGFVQNIIYLYHLRIKLSKEFSEYAPIVPTIWRQAFLPVKHYLVGLIVPAVDFLLLKKPMIYSSYGWYNLLECWIFISAIMYVAYPIMHYLTVCNEAHLLYGSEKTFKILFALVAIVFYSVFAAIGFL